MLTAEIIAIGSELLTPERTDTNSLWLTEKLNAIGVEVMLKTIVGDDEVRLEEVIRDAMKRSHVVITTGGLGPTEDDLTRQIAAKAVGRGLVYHDHLEADLRERFKRWGRDMPEINKRQAYVIDGAKILPNPNGSAVGMMLEADDRLLAVFPGPPREMRPMFENFVRPAIAVKAGGIVVCRRVMRVSGIGESAVDEKIAPIYKSYPEIQTSILFSRVEIEVHISTKTTDPDEGDRLLEEVVEGMQAALGNAMFATNGETMEVVIGQLLKERGETISVAESCTGGLIGMRLTEVSGSSSYFLDGAVTYSNASKMRDLGVPESLILDHGAVSAEVAEAMAEGIRKRSQATHAISVTGIAGPEGGTEEKPVGTVFIGYSSISGTRSVKFVFPGDRELVRWRSSQAALDYLRRQILKVDALGKNAAS